MCKLFESWTPSGRKNRSWRLAIAVFGVRFFVFDVRPLSASAGLSSECSSVASSANSGEFVAARSEADSSTSFKAGSHPRLSVPFGNPPHRATLATTGS
eukprot:2529091-Amphidinium_carterae.1